jgi:hypothetical protein
VLHEYAPYRSLIDWVRVQVYLARLAAAANGLAHLLIAIPFLLGLLYALSPSSLASRTEQTETYRYGYPPGQAGRDGWTAPEPTTIAVIGAIALVSIVVAGIYTGCFVAVRRSPVPALQVARLLFFIEMGITIVLAMPGLAEVGWTLLSACVGVLWFSRGIDAGREVSRLGSHVESVDG